MVAYNLIKKKKRIATTRCVGRIIIVSLSSSSTRILFFTTSFCCTTLHFSTELYVFKESPPHFSIRIPHRPITLQRFFILPSFFKIRLFLQYVVVLLPLNGSREWVDVVESSSGLVCASASGLAPPGGRRSLGHELVQRRLLNFGLERVLLLLFERIAS